jgi:hypothetical protein
MFHSGLEERLSTAADNHIASLAPALQRLGQPPARQSLQGHLSNPCEELEHAVLMRSEVQRPSSKSGPAPLLPSRRTLSSDGLADAGAAGGAGAAGASVYTTMGGGPLVQVPLRDLPGAPRDAFRGSVGPAGLQEQTGAKHHQSAHQNVVVLGCAFLRRAELEALVLPARRRRGPAATLHACKAPGAPHSAIPLMQLAVQPVFAVPPPPLHTHERALRYARRCYHLPIVLGSPSNAAAASSADAEAAEAASSSAATPASPAAAAAAAGSDSNRAAAVVCEDLLAARCGWTVSVAFVRYLVRHKQQLLRELLQLRDAEEKRDAHRPLDALLQPALQLRLERYVEQIEEMGVAMQRVMLVPEEAEAVRDGGGAAAVAVDVDDPDLDMRPRARTRSDDGDGGGDKKGGFVVGSGGPDVTASLPATAASGARYRSAAAGDGANPRRKGSGAGSGARKEGREGREGKEGKEGKEGGAESPRGGAAGDEGLASTPRSYIKRSAQKASLPHRFLGTNLNVHALHVLAPAPPPLASSAVSPADAAAAAAGLSAPPEWRSAYTVTFGAAAAHTMGFKHGGLERQLQTLERAELQRWRRVEAIRTAGQQGKLQDKPGALEELEHAQDKEYESVRLAVEARMEVVTSQMLAVAMTGVLAAVEAHAALAPVQEVVQEAVAEGAVADDPAAAAALHGAAAAAAVERCAAVAAKKVENAAAGLGRAAECGQLVSVECLLSTHGAELGMLEDLIAGTRWLKGVQVRHRVTHRNTP